MRHYKNETGINEIKRFAGEKSISHALVPHWLPISKEGCQALYDCGVRILSPSYGERTEYTGDPETLPYGHAGRLFQNRKPDTEQKFVADDLISLLKV